MKEKIKQAFIDISNNPDEIAIMDDIYSHKGYAEAVDSEYDEVREYLERQKSWNFD